jgi:hypothetical protein
MAQATAVVIAVISAVMHTNQVVAVALNRVMTAAALMTVVHAQSAQAASKRAMALAVMTIVATVIPLLVQATLTLVAATGQLMTGRVNFLTALTQPAHKVTALKVIAQRPVRLAAALVTALPLAKNLTHAITLARHVATATVIAVATVTMPTVVTTAY